MSDIDQQVFIGGCSRSGTTLLGALLGAHSDCICTPESQFKFDVLRLYDRDMEANKLQSALKFISGHWRFKLWELDLFGGGCEKMASYPHLLSLIVEEYARKLKKANARIWVDHTPSNLRYVNTLLGLFPSAKLIHIVRDGRAVANSVMPLDWGPNTIDGAARWWVEHVAYGLSAEINVSGDQIVRVGYEDLVYNPEKTLKCLCSFMEIEYQRSMTRGGGFRAPKYTRSQHSLINEIPDSSRCAAWKSELAPRQIEIFESLTGDFLQSLGYSLKYGLKASPPNDLEWRVTEIKDWWRRAANRIKRIVRKRKSI